MQTCRHNGVLVCARFLIVQIDKHLRTITELPIIVILRFAIVPAIVSTRHQAQIYTCAKTHDRFSPTLRHLGLASLDLNNCVAIKLFTGLACKLCSGMGQSSHASD